MKLNIDLRHRGDGKTHTLIKRYLSNQKQSLILVSSAEEKKFLIRDIKKFMERVEISLDLKKVTNDIVTPKKLATALHELENIKTVLLVDEFNLLKVEDKLNIEVFGKLFNLNVFANGTLSKGSGNKWLHPLMYVMENAFLREKGIYDVLNTTLVNSFSLSD